MLDILRFRIKSFNPRAPMGRDGAYASTSCGYLEFQSTRPMGRDAVRSNMGLYFFMFQSTRPHGARRGLPAV